MYIAELKMNDISNIKPLKAPTGVVMKHGGDLFMKSQVYCEA